MFSLSSGDRSPFGFPDTSITGTLPQSTMHARIGLSSDLNQVSEAGRHTFICNQRCQLRGVASLLSKSLRWNRDRDPLCRVAFSQSSLSLPPELLSLGVKVTTRNYWKVLCFEQVTPLAFRMLEKLRSTSFLLLIGVDFFKEAFLFPRCSTSLDSTRLNTITSDPCAHIYPFIITASLFPLSGRFAAFLFWALVAPFLCLP
jgi:hypothetical protein